LDYIEYPYRPKPTLMARCLFFFGAGAIIMAFTAMRNDRGLILNGIIHFETQGATIFYWCITAVCAGFAAIGFMGILFGYFSSQFLRLSATELSAPKFILSLENTIVPLSSIIRLELQTIRNLHFLKVHHIQGKLSISAQNLPDAEAFAEVCARLADHHLGQRTPGTSDPGAYTRTPLQEQPFTRPPGERAGFLRIALVVAVFAALLFAAFGILALMNMGPWAHG
jgi:hypothetical protein